MRLRPRPGVGWPLFYAEDRMADQAPILNWHVWNVRAQAEASSWSGPRYR